LTPPFQSPDEGAHYSRAYELTDFQFSKMGKTIPTSIYTLDSTLLRLHFNPEEKTSKEEILRLTKIKLTPENRRPSSGQDYIVPYLPQFIGFTIGRLFKANPLYLLYFGRILNLFLAIGLVFYAIKIAPFLKWIFFLLALMPKTVSLMASLSYDAFVISCSFLAISMFLYYAFKAEKLSWKDIGFLFFLTLLLALCKPPYFLIGFLFLIIPVRKIGSLPKYLMILSVLVVSMLLAQGMWSLVGGLIKSANQIKSEQISTLQKPSNEGKTGKTNVSANNVKDTASAAAQNVPKRPEINPSRQFNQIRNNPMEFVSLLFKTNVFHMRENMMTNFVSAMGWLDTFLPDILVDLYLILIMIAALCIAEERIRIDWRRKTFFLILFLSSVLAIETAMYVYSSYVGQERLYGVQGRYFIPIAPLLLLIFYNNFISEKLNYAFSSKRRSYLKAKLKLKPTILFEIQHELIFTKYLQILIIAFTVLTLMRGIGSVLLRYYEW